MNSQQQRNALICQLRELHHTQSPAWAGTISRMITVTAAHHTASLNELHKKQGIKLTPLALLYAVMDAGGQTSQKQLSENFPYTVQSLTLSLNWLEEKGYIERSTDEFDKRARTIRLTDAGIECIREGLALRQSYYDQFTQIVSAKEAQILIDLLTKIDSFYQSQL